MEKDLSYKFVSELEEATYLSANDLFLISQIERSGVDLKNDALNDIESNEYQSKYLKYSQLCSVVTKDIDKKIRDSMDDSLKDLSSAISTNLSLITELSNNQNQHLSAIVKMANCIQVNKSNISALSNTLFAVKGVNGIHVDIPNQKEWTIGHNNFTKKVDDYKVLALKYDEYGHILSSKNIELSDIDYFIPISGATNGIYVNDYKQVSLLTAGSSIIGGVKIDNSITANNLRIDQNGFLSARDTTYGIATYSKAGIIRVDSTSFDGKNYPVKISNDFAYVNVPWTDSGKEAGTYTRKVDNENQTISSITATNGVITIGKSSSLYNKLYAVSSDVYNLNIPKLSSHYIGDNGNASMTIVNNDLYLKLGSVNIAKVSLSEMQSKDLTAVTYVTTKKEESSTITGCFLKFDFSKGESIYCDIQSLKDTFIDKVTYDSDKKALIFKFNAESQHDDIVVPISDITKDVVTAEEWVFTLSDGTTVKKSVMLKK